MPASDHTRNICLTCATYATTGDPRSFEALGVPPAVASSIMEAVDALPAYRAIEWNDMTVRPAGAMQVPCYTCGDTTGHLIPVRNAVATDFKPGTTFTMTYPGPGDVEVSITSSAVEALAKPALGWLTTGEYDTYSERLRDLRGRKLRRALDRLVLAGAATMDLDDADDAPAVADSETVPF